MFMFFFFFYNLNTSSVLFWRKTKRLKLNACVGGRVIEKLLLRDEENLIKMKMQTMTDSFQFKSSM